MLAVTSENVTVIVAFGGGIISILSPCVLPMVPGYLSVVTGFSVAELDEGGHERLGRVTLMTALFTLGFGTVFTVLGLAASAIGQAAFDNQQTLTRVSGAIVMAMALYLAGSQLLMAPRLYPEKRLLVTRRFGWATAPIVGAAFGFGWSPCLGPVLAAVVGAAATQTSARAVTLLAAYSIGMGASFLAVGHRLRRVGGRARLPAPPSAHHHARLGGDPVRIRRAAVHGPARLADRPSHRLPGLARPQWTG